MQRPRISRPEKRKYPVSDVWGCLSLSIFALSFSGCCAKATVAGAPLPDEYRQVSACKIDKLDTYQDLVQGFQAQHQCIERYQAQIEGISQWAEEQDALRK